MTFDQFCARIERLRLDRSGGKPKPYKPLLLAAVVLLIHKGKILSREVLLDGGLRSAFEQLLRLAFPEWPTPAKIEYPFRHLENDGIWDLIPDCGKAAALGFAREQRAEAWHVLKHVRCARLPADVYSRLASDLSARLRVLALLRQHYLPAPFAADLLALLQTPQELGPVAAHAGDSGSYLCERAVEEHLETHWEQTPFHGLGVELARRESHGLPGRQVLTPVNAIDLLGFSSKRRQWWVFELKRGRTSDAVVGQVSRYLTWIRDQHASDGESAVGVVLTNRVDTKLEYSVRANPHLSLWRYDEALKLEQVA